MGNKSFLVIGNDQMAEHMTVYDLGKIPEDGSLEDGAVWSFPSGHSAGVKYRENTVFGDVMLFGGSRSYMVSYPSGEILWFTDCSGNNTHSVEILPGGNLVFANSTGNDLRLFRTSALLTGDKETAATYTSYPFGCTHGVLYDPVYECLWVIGEWDLAAYRIVGQGTEQTMEPIEGKSYSLKPFGNAGHDLSPDLLDSRYLYCTPASGVLRFDKETGAFDTSFADGTPLQSYSFKSFTQFPDGTYVYTAPYCNGRRRMLEDWWKGSWCTDFIGVLRHLPDGSRQETRYFADVAAFYKCRALCGRYL